MSWQRFLLSTARNVFFFSFVTVTTALIAEELRTWTDDTGKHRIVASITRFDAEHQIVQLKKVDGQTLAIPLAKLSQGDQQYAKNAAERFASNPAPSTAGQRPPALLDAPSEVANALTESEGATIVIVEGVGISTEASLQDAFREAVRQVVGSFIDAETQISNDQLIEGDRHFRNYLPRGHFGLIKIWAKRATQLLNSRKPPILRILPRQPGPPFR